MRSLNKLGVYYIAALCSISCGKLSLKEDAASEEPRIQNLEIDSIKAIAGTNPNEYSVAISWSGAEVEQFRYVLRSENIVSEDSVEVKEFQVSQNTFKFFDHEVDAGKSYSYKLYSKDPATAIHKKEFNIVVPKDLVVDGVVIQSSQINFDNVIGRIYLLNSGVIKSNGAALSLEVNEIHSDGGRVSSQFSAHAGRSGRHGRAGSSGGEIRLSAQRFLGDLTILAHGQDGGPGLDHHFDRGNGGNGGDSSQVFVEIREDFLGDILVERIPGRGGRGGDGRMNPDGHPGRAGYQSPYCIRTVSYQEGDGCRVL